MLKANSSREVFDILNSKSISDEIGEKKGKIRFGNKYVEKDTTEYLKQRTRNTDAVKKSRQKKQKMLVESEERLKNIRIENNQLYNQVMSIRDELKRLLTTISNIDPDFKLPDRINSELTKVETQMSHDFMKF